MCKPCTKPILSFVLAICLGSSGQSDIPQLPNCGGMISTGRLVFKPSPIEFVTRHSPRYSELDPQGHLNAKHYQDYATDHWFTGLRVQFGIDLRKYARILPFKMMIRSNVFDFEKEIAFDDEFEIHSRIIEVGETSFVISVNFYTPGESVPLTLGLITVICVDKKTSKPIPWPQDFLNLFYPPS